MILFKFNKEFEEGDWTDKPATYVVADNMEDAIKLYEKGPNNNSQIWSVTRMGNPVLVAK